MLTKPHEPLADTAFRQEIAEMIVEVLVLDDVTAAEIDPHQPLFGDGLGLDSIDAL
jgi:acyl carrier protein